MGERGDQAGMAGRGGSVIGEAVQCRAQLTATEQVRWQGRGCQPRRWTHSGVSVGAVRWFLWFNLVALTLNHGSLPPPPMQGRNMFHPSDLLVPAGLHKSVAGRCRHSSSGGGSSDPDGGDGASGPLPRLAWQLLVGAGVKLLGGDIAPQEGEAGLVAPPPAPRPAGMLGGALGMVRS